MDIRIVGNKGEVLGRKNDGRLPGKERYFGRYWNMRGGND
jgi:hypothetical protein